MSHYRTYPSDVGAQVTGPAIVWDPREPPPPHLRMSQQGGFGTRKPETGLGWPSDVYQGDSGVLRYQNDQFKPRVDDVVGASPANVETASGGFLPPVSLSVNVDITHDTAKVVSTQLFMNNTGSIIPKAGYTFPLPPESTVIGFSCRIGRDRVFKGKVRPKQEARDLFEDAVRKDTTAGLLEQSSQDLFTTTLGNIPAGTRLKASLTFILLLKHSFKSPSMTFSLPTYIAPRYGTPPDDIDRLIPGSGSVSRLSCSVDVLAHTDIFSLTSPSHPIADIQVGAATRQRWTDFVANRVDRDPRCATVRLTDGTNYLDRDFTLVISFAQSAVPEMPFACIERHPEMPNHAALMLTLPPKFLIGPQREYPGGEIVLVADRSGSMDNKIHALKSAMAFFIASLPLGCNFNIWSFGSTFSSLWPHSQGYTPATRQEAEMHVETQFHADMGGTALLRALEALMTGRSEGFTDVIVLTDGQIWEQDETIQFIRQAREQTEGRARFFSLGIGEAVSHQLVEGIAKAGGGYAEVIHTASQGGWEGNLLDILAAAQEPHVSPVSIELERVGSTLEDEQSGEILQPHRDISSLSPFMQNRVFMLLPNCRKDSSRTVALVRRTRSGADEEPLEVPVTALQTPSTTIHKFAARELLGDLERAGRHTGQNDSYWESAKQIRLVRQQGEELGCKWSLASSWTSFVAVEERVEASELGGDPFLDYNPDSTIGLDDGRRELNLLRPHLPGNSSQRIQEATSQTNLDQTDWGQTNPGRIEKELGGDASDISSSTNGECVAVEPDNDPCVSVTAESKGLTSASNRHPEGECEGSFVLGPHGKVNDVQRGKELPNIPQNTTEEDSGGEGDPASPREIETEHSRPEPLRNMMRERSKRALLKAGITALWKRMPHRKRNSGPSLRRWGPLSHIVGRPGSPPAPYRSPSLVPSLHLARPLGSSALEPPGRSLFRSATCTSPANAVCLDDNEYMEAGEPLILTASLKQENRLKPAVSECSIGSPGPQPRPPDPATARFMSPCAWETVRRNDAGPTYDRWGYSAHVNTSAYPPNVSHKHGTIFGDPAGSKPIAKEPDFYNDQSSGSIPKGLSGVSIRPEADVDFGPPKGQQVWSMLDAKPSANSSREPMYSAQSSVSFAGPQVGPAPSPLSTPTELPAKLESEAISGVEAPTNNLLPAPVLRFSHPVLTGDAVKQGKRELVRSLLPFQSAATGEFLATANAGKQSYTMESILGVGFEAFVIASAAEYRGTLSGLSAMVDILLGSLSRTIAVATLLKLHFSSCADLFVPISSKAASYIASKLGPADHAKASDFSRRHLARATFHLDGIPSSTSTAENLGALGLSSIVIQIPLPKAGGGPAEAGQRPTEQQTEGSAYGEPTEEFIRSEAASTSRTLSTRASNADKLSMDDGSVLLQSVAVDQQLPGTYAPGCNRRISCDDHEDLIQRLAAERASRGEVGVEETGVPVDI